MILLADYDPGDVTCLNKIWSCLVLLLVGPIISNFVMSKRLVLIYIVGLPNFNFIIYIFYIKNNLNRATGDSCVNMLLIFSF